TLTSFPCRMNHRPCPGPLAKAMALSLSAPKLFSPGLSQNRPASGNHFSFRFSTSAAFHLSNDCWSAAVIAGAAGVSPATGIRVLHCQAVASEGVGGVLGKNFV